VKAGEVTEVTADPWLNQLGWVSFDSKQSVSLRVRVVRVPPSDQATPREFSLYSRASYPILAGTYDIVLLDPYVGLQYKSVAINVGQETVLKLPD